MAKIKVTVKDLDQANEIIEYWKDKDVELLIDVKPDGTFLGKENTTTENSDVNSRYSVIKLKSLDKVQCNCK